MSAIYSSSYQSQIPNLEEAANRARARTLARESIARMDARDKEAKEDKANNKKYKPSEDRPARHIPWNSYDYEFKTGDRILVSTIHANGGQQTILHEINIIETSIKAIKTREYDWHRRDWKVSIVEILDSYKINLIEKM